ncbi:hypothetical protein HYPSUDRAFT_203868 [Hypholoma sublateritium FD-334 SS-4]|uniref:Uncharacterized protein n=1 Tax=Hypholoma sublateritium (strain FD-334 SS-4) TaxID=945553 RepID=A0A0D2PK77_HYPSF|nr:hypothetical protein HYPSUDRAFT_203868 [Hypholoma sublateritium FD-334 SS-4]
MPLPLRMLVSTPRTHIGATLVTTLHAWPPRPLYRAVACRARLRALAPATACPSPLARRCVSPQGAARTRAYTSVGALNGASSAHTSPSSSTPRTAPVPPAPLDVPGTVLAASPSLRSECSPAECPSSAIHQRAFPSGDHAHVLGPPSAPTSRSPHHATPSTLPLLPPLCPLPRVLRPSPCRLTSPFSIPTYAKREERCTIRIRAPHPQRRHSHDNAARCTTRAIGHRERYTAPPRAGHASMLPPPPLRLFLPFLSLTQRSVLCRLTCHVHFPPNATSPRLPPAPAETAVNRERSALHGASSARASPSSITPVTAPAPPAPLAVPGKVFVVSPCAATATAVPLNVPLSARSAARAYPPHRPRPRPQYSVRTLYPLLAVAAASTPPLLPLLRSLPRVLRPSRPRGAAPHSACLLHAPLHPRRVSPSVPRCRSEPRLLVRRPRRSHSMFILHQKFRRVSPSAPRTPCATATPVTLNGAYSLRRPPRALSSVLYPLHLNPPTIMRTTRQAHRDHHGP